MALVQLTLESLANFDDGRIQIALNEELKRIVLDCMDRPDKKPRKLTLTLSCSPVVYDGDVEGVNVEFEIASKLPTRKSMQYHLNCNRAGMLTFSENNPRDYRQTHIDDLSEE